MARLLLVDYINAKYLLQEFDDTRDAEDAVYELNGKSIMGDR